MLVFHRCMGFDQSLGKHHDGDKPVELFCFQQEFHFKLGHETKITLVPLTGSRSMFDVDMFIRSDKISKNN